MISSSNDKGGIMSEADHVKAILEFIKFGMTAFSGLLFIMFWNLMADPNIVKNMDWDIKVIVLLITGVISLILFVFMYSYIRYADKLKKL